jgi:putative ATP-dependent endonuclease of OLD family
MRIDRVEIEDYRGIERVAIDLDDLTTIIGEPDGGKSSLLRGIARVLDPRQPDALPVFGVSDFHRPGDSEDGRATVLAITLGLRAEANDPLIPDDEAFRNGLRDGGVSLHVVAQRRDVDDPTTHVTVIDRAGAVMDAIDGPALLARLRRRHPAVIVGGPRPSISRRTTDQVAGSRLRTVLLRAAEPNAPLTWDELVDVRDDLVKAAGRLADQLGPTPTPSRSVRDITDTPRPLSTDLGAALEEDAGQQRRIAALWLLVAILDALPPGGIGEEAEPILLFDDIEANLHPTWLAAMSAVAFNLPFQEVVATHSPEVLTWVPLSSLRRLVRGTAGVEVYSINSADYASEELRRLTYHLRVNRGNAFFARCWILVEGETEAWLVPEFARIVGVGSPSRASAASSSPNRASNRWSRWRTTWASVGSCSPMATLLARTTHAPRPNTSRPAGRERSSCCRRRTSSTTFLTPAMTMSSVRRRAVAGSVSPTK